MKTRLQSSPMSGRDHSSGLLSSRGRTLRSNRATKAKTTTPRKSHRLRSFHAIEEQLDSPSDHLSVTHHHHKKAKSPKLNKTKTRLPSDKCNFCNTDTDADYELGELRKCEDITAHMFCLFFAPGLTQNGELHEGINGFLPEDIRKELRRGTLLKCSYCSKRGAVVGCTVPECHRNYHLPCGLANGASTQFHEETGMYPSYCKQHRPKLTVPAFKGKKLCTICQENVKYGVDRNNLLFLKCCQTYFHRECLVKLAYHQGQYHLKCPNCKNDKEFIATLKRGGIYVPHRDATWELTGELNWNEVVFECSAAECNCADGRNHNGDNEWELFACDRCGSSAVHVACAGLDNATEWVCDICSNVQQ